jgi:hypothetical protein
VILNHVLLRLRQHDLGGLWDFVFLPLGVKTGNEGRGKEEEGISTICSNSTPIGPPKHGGDRKSAVLGVTGEGRDRSTTACIWVTLSLTCRRQMGSN